MFADAAPALIDATEIGQKLADEAAAGRLPPPTADRLYVVYTPPGTTVLRLGFKSCEAFAGTHLDQAAGAMGSPLVFAVIPRCHSSIFSDQDYLTLTASHEIAEAITDPIAGAPGWFALGPTSTGGEIADACLSAQVGGYRVAQLYSNAAALADQRPCLPTPPGPMCGVWAAESTLQIARGASTDVSLHVYFTAPTDPMNSLLFFFSGSTARIDPMSSVSVQNGDVISARISVPADAPVSYHDLITLSVRCGDRTYSSQFYINVEPPTPAAARPGMRPWSPVQQHAGHGE